MDHIGKSRIDRCAVRSAFEKYANAYNTDDIKISLKIEHTYRVADLCDQIGRTLELSDEQIDVLWVCGMLHDIGRFEQVTRYGTFMDAQSVDHALLAAALVFGKAYAENEKACEVCLPDDCAEGMIRDFIEIADYDSDICVAIRWHSAYHLPENLSSWQKLCAQVLRDADKIDIFRVNMETPFEDIYNVTGYELRHCAVTPEVMDAFWAHHTVLRSLKKTAVDHIVGHICLAYELVYPKSRELVTAQGYLDKMMLFQSEDKTANEQMCQIREHMLTWLQENT